MPLSFLADGKYEALVIQDGPQSDYRTHAEDYQAATGLHVSLPERFNGKSAFALAIHP